MEKYTYFVANPTVNYYFITDATLIQFDVNALLRLDLGTPLTPYGGIGVALTFDDQTDFSLTFNPFIAGADFDLFGDLGGFAQFRATRHTFGEPGATITVTTLGLMGGVNFRF